MKATTQGWLDETLSIPVDQRLVHWVVVTMVKPRELWSVRLICREVGEGGMKTTRYLPWRGSEEVTCLFCLTHPNFAWVL